MRQTFNLLALMFSGFVVGYIAGLNPQVDFVQAAQKETFTARVSAYCPCSKCCGGSADGITANGHKIKSGEKFCAADKRYAFGTMFTIPGYGRVPVWDRGGAIKGDRIDVFFDDDLVSSKSGHQRAIEWGVRNLVVTIEKRGR